MEQLQHFCHLEHPLVFIEDERHKGYCSGCWNQILGLSYSCIQCDRYTFLHDKLCAELPLGVHHPLHPIYPLILFNKRIYRYEEYGKCEKYGKCEICKETHDEYTY